MNVNRIIAKITSSAAVLFILFLPLIGCQGEELTGVELISHDDMWVEVKVLLVVAIVFGGVVLLLSNRVHMGVSALLAVAALTIAFFIATTKNEFFELRNGAYFALIGFLVTVIVSFTGRAEQSD